jgi:hypothetical protein
MTAKKRVVAAHGLNGSSAGKAAAQALRKVKFLSEKAPTGRLFASIATMSDLSQQAAAAFEAASLAELKSDTATADLRFKRGMSFANELELAGAGAPVPLPEFIRRKK